MIAMQLKGKRRIRTLDDVRTAYHGSFPGFLALRHALSIVILAHHSRILLRGLEDRHLTAGVAAIEQAGNVLASPTELLRPLLYALVGSFFALSGFLVTGSALRTRLVGRFLTLRGLRIFPALCSEILLSALILGPIVTVLALGLYYTDSRFWSYFLNIIGIVHYELPGVFVNNPVPNMVNANLWTLGPEFYCYLITAALMVSGVIYNRRLALYFGLLLLIAYTVCLHYNYLGITTRIDATRFSRVFIVYMFFIGVLFALYSDKIPVSRVLFLLCGTAYMVLMRFPSFDVISGLLLTYCIIYLGTIDFSRFDKIFKSDYSYGIYLYGYPITQTLIFVLLPFGFIGKDALSTIVLCVISLIATLIFSSLSWRFVEEPALQLRKYVLPKVGES